MDAGACGEGPIDRIPAPGPPIGTDAGIQAGTSAERPPLPPILPPILPPPDEALDGVRPAGLVLLSLHQGEALARDRVRDLLASPDLASCRWALELLLAQHARAAALLEARAQGHEGAWALDGAGRATSAHPASVPLRLAAPPARAQIEALQQHEAQWTRTLESAAGTAGLSHADRELIASTLLPMQRSHEALLAEVVNQL